MARGSLNLGSRFLRMAVAWQRAHRPIDIPSRRAGVGHPSIGCDSVAPFLSGSLFNALEKLLLAKVYGVDACLQSVL